MYINIYNFIDTIKNLKYNVKMQITSTISVSQRHFTYPEFSDAFITKFPDIQLL